MDTTPGSGGRMEADQKLKATNDAAAGSGAPAVHFERVFQILNEQCVPCHSSTADHPNASAKLDLTAQAASYDQLVGGPARGGACNDGVRTLVVAGDPAASLLIQKLENAAGLCGSPMPKASGDQAFEPIAATQIDEIKAWIRAGALND
jgi:hypothetical protein